MSETNERTLKSYNNHLQEYIDGTPHEVESDASIKAWIDKALSMLPENGVILEIGSGFGRDADYIEQAGFKVVRTEAAHSFVDYLNKNKKGAIELNVITDEIEGEYDMVFANAVLLHLTPDEFGDCFRQNSQRYKWCWYFGFFNEARKR